MNFAKRLGSFQTRFFKPAISQLFRSKILFVGVFSFLYQKDFKLQLQEQNQQQTVFKMKKTIEFEQFSDSAYQKAQEDKCDTIVFIDPSRFREDFIDEVEQFLEQLNKFQQMVNGRKLKFFKLDLENIQQLQNFKTKYDVQIESDSVLLLQNRYKFEHYLDIYRYMKGFFLVEPYDFFDNKEYILKYFRKVSKLNMSSWDKFSNHLDQLTSDQTVIIGYVKKDSQDYKDQVKKFGILSLYRSYCDNRNIHTILVNDEKVAQKLGLDEPGNLYILTKSSKLNRKISNIAINNYKFQVDKSTKILDKLINQIDVNSKIYNKNQTFVSRGFDPDINKFTLVLELDKNKVNKQEYSKLIESIGSLKNSLQISNTHQDIAYILSKKSRHKAKDDQAFALYLRDEEKGMIQTKLYHASTKEQVDSILNETSTKENQRTYNYFYNLNDINDINVENLTKWIDDVKSGKIEDYFKSSKPPTYQKFSQKLVGSTFKQNVIDNDVDQAVFLYSKNCHACKYYGPVFEQLAKENLKQNKEQQIQFNRMDSDANILDCSENFPYTPVFAFYKNGAKESPIVYKNEKFTPQLLEDFFNVSSEFQLIRNLKIFSRLDVTKQYQQKIKELIF